MGIHIMPPLFELVIVPVEVETTIISDTASGFMATTQSLVYATVHDALESPPAGIYDTQGLIDLMQSLDITPPFLYQIYRGFLFFDTSPLVGKNIKSAKLRLYITSVNIGAGDIVVQNGQPTYPHKPLVVGDYYYGHYSGNGGEIAEGDLVVNQANYITLNAIGLTWINKTGWTKLCLRLSKDIDSIAPSSGYWYHRFTTVEGAATDDEKPALIVTYF